MLDNINMKELNKLNTIKFYTYKNILYALIYLNLLTHNNKNQILSKYYDNLNK